MFKYIIIIIYEVPTPGRAEKKNDAENKKSCRKKRVVPKKTVVPQKNSRAREN